MDTTIPSKPRQFTGRALAAKVRHQHVFEDPKWEQRLECLIQLTQRTQLIKDLTATDVPLSRIKDAIDKRLHEMGGVIARPRGIGQSYEAKGFLAKLVEKYDAAYLMALHFGATGSGSSATVETDLGLALDKRIETYLRYRTDLYDDPNDARISFETYIVMLSGIQNRSVSVQVCKECSAKYLWTQSSALRTSCPICAVHELDVTQAKKKLQMLLSAKGQGSTTPYQNAKVAA